MVKLPEGPTVVVVAILLVFVHALILALCPDQDTAPTIVLEAPDVSEKNPVPVYVKEEPETGISAGIVI